MRKYVIDKILELKSREISPIVRPWVKTWEGMSAGVGSSLNVRSFERYYTNCKKPFIALGPEDYKAVSCPSQYFTEVNRANGNTCFYTTPASMVFWMRADSAISDRYELILAPVSFSDKVPPMMKLKRLLQPDRYPLSMPVDTMRYINVDSMRLYYIPKVGLRTVVGVNKIVD